LFPLNVKNYISTVIIPWRDMLVAANDFLTNKIELPYNGFSKLAVDITGLRYQTVFTLV